MKARFNAVVSLSALLASCGSVSDDTPAPWSQGEVNQEQEDSLATHVRGQFLPTGVRITPDAARGAVLSALDPENPESPGFLADHPVTTALSPDGGTLLVLTTGYNRYTGPTGSRVVEASNEYVFIFDVSSGTPVKKQVVEVPNTFTGMAWHPSGHEFYVSGGVDDNLHVYDDSSGVFAEVSTVALGHTAGLGLQMQPMAGGLAVNANGTRAVIANYANDSISVVDLEARVKLAELDLRPGKNDASQTGVAGGEYPTWPAILGDTAYIASQRDAEVVVVSLAGAAPKVVNRIEVGQSPARLLLDRSGKRLFVANATSDTVSVIDTSRNRVIETIETAAPSQFGKLPHGSNPNSLALSPDERTLYVTNAGTNSLAVVALGSNAKHFARRSRVIGLIPTGWYPSSVSVSADGRGLYVANAKSGSGPNPDACRDTVSTSSADLTPCRASNQYVWQLEKGGLLSLPVPSSSELARLTAQVAANNNFGFDGKRAHDASVMRALRKRIQHVIYVIKENRTYDQVLGDLDGTDGDASLTIFPEAISPNHHRLARNFVALDRFFDSGETSGVGWNWTLAARTTDSIEKTQPPNYAGRGLAYDWEGTNRNINVGIPTLEERQAALSYTPDDPDLLPGTADVASHAVEADGTEGYLWDAALAKGLSVRNYGCFGDLTRYYLPTTDPEFIPLVRQPFAANSVQFYPAKESLKEVTDLYFRGYDMRYPDFWLYKEWEREFDQYVESGSLPNLQLVRLPHDHLGSFATALDGVNTPETQMADNDYAVGLLIEKVAKSPYADSTLVFVIEDDAQDGPDHVDAHRSIALIAGPHVKKNVVVSTPYTTVNLVRTIEDVLGLEPMGITDGLASPMTEIFDLSPSARSWTYDAVVPEVLYSTQLPLPARAVALALATSTPRVKQPRHPAAYWEKAMAGQNFEREDDLDTAAFNRALWKGLKDQPFPGIRRGLFGSNH